MHGREQSGVVEGSDADDRLQGALDAGFQNISTENIENNAGKQTMMIRVARSSEKLGKLLNFGPLSDFLPIF